ncbi:adenylate/guanylate cyclase domain-containing protein [Stagnimonas aquatica]|nr:adenylate/guanylate cyclase domain-containing protein [Stagnimonas aquatica]
MIALAPMLPHLLVALVAVGMALAFLLADGRAPTSRALALALSSMGVGIVVNFGYIQMSVPEVVPGWTGWLALPEALAMAAFLEWLLRVRRTIPSGNLDVRGGDGVIRLGQAAALVYLVESLLWPELRVQQFYGAARHGALGFSGSGFWRFAVPVLLVAASGLFSTLLLLNRRPDVSEKLRVLGFVAASPFMLAAFVLPYDYAALSVTAGLMTLLAGATQYHVLQGQRGQFMSRFLSPQVADIVSRKGLRGAMQEAHLEISIVCCDLRGFTAYAQAHPSSRVLEVLRDYYAAVGAVVAEYGGTIKDYAGDGVLILVGAPLAIPDHAKVSLEIAERIRKDCHTLTQRWSSRKGKLGIGIGVASGYVTVGVIGSASRLEYTAVGPAVNLASRLCEQAEDREVLVAPRTAELAGRELEAQPARAMKGFANLKRIYALEAA